MSELTAKELEAIHKKVEAELEKNGPPSDKDIEAEIAALNGSGKTAFEDRLTKLCGPKKKKPVAKDEPVAVHADRQQQVAALFQAPIGKTRDS